jgi:hypothetical protein
MITSRTLALGLVMGAIFGSGMRLWLGSNAPGGIPAAAQAESVEKPTRADQPRGEPDGIHMASVVSGAGEAREPETVLSVLAARGFEASERLARFLPKAGPAELAALMATLLERDGGLDEAMTEAVFLRWMIIDPAGGQVFAEKHSLGRMAWRAWGKVDPEAAMAAVQASRDLATATSALGAIAEIDPQRVQAWLDHHPQFRTHSVMLGVASGLMATDPAAGATLAAAWSTEPVDQGGLVRRWAQRDPDAAWAWAQSLPDRARRNDTLQVLVDQWARTDPDRLSSAITSLPDGWNKWRLYVEHGARLAASDPASARAWVEAAPTELLRREATLEMARGLSGTHPEAAVAVLRNLDWSSFGETSGITIRTPSGSAGMTSYHPTSSVEEIARAAPEATVSYASSLPSDAPWAASMMSRAFSEWVGQDAMAASQWLANQPESQAKYASTHALIRQLTQGHEPDFDSAYRWALTLPDDDETRYIQRNIIREWAQRDPAAAHAARDQYDVVPEDQPSSPRKP